MTVGHIDPTTYNTPHPNGDGVVGDGVSVCDLITDPSRLPKGNFWSHDLFIPLVKGDRGLFGQSSQQLRVKPNNPGGLWSSIGVEHLNGGDGDRGDRGKQS